MKRLLFLFIVVFCINPLYGQKKKSVQSHKIKSTTVYNADFEDNNGKQIKESFERFDDSGNTVEEIEYDKKGIEKKHILSEYDDDGNKTKETYLNENGSKEKMITYKYQDGLKTERIVYNADGKVKSKKKYIYEFQK
jgi:hypothetical protein